MLEDERYVEQFRDRRNIHIKCSIITLDEDKAKRIEKGVTSPLKRIEFLKRIKELGVAATTLRLRPFIIGASEDTMEELLSRAADAGVYSVSSEFLCVEGRAGEKTKSNMRELSKVVGYDVMKFYRQHSNASGLQRLNYEIKRPYFERMEALCNKYGIKLFISDAHHKEKSHGAGCCGIPPEEALIGRVRTGQYTGAILIAKERGYVRWSDIEEQAQGLKNVPFKHADNFNQGSTMARAKHYYSSLYDTMRETWNNTKSQSSPARYFGGALVPAGSDEEGDIVYLYNLPYVKDGVHVASAEELAELIGVDLCAVLSDYQPKNRELICAD
jgi:hypothetical protein